MNRTQPPLGKPGFVPSSQKTSGKQSPDVQAAYNPRIAFGNFNTRTKPVPRAVFSPLHYEPGYAYPLLIWLHGPGDDERQLRQIMPLISLRNYVAIAPRGTRALADNGKCGFAWEQTVQQIENAAESVTECIDFAKDRFHIAASRLFLAGYHSGGTMAIRLACQFPERFAGIISFGGAFPQGLHPLRQINALRKLPMLLTMGRDGRSYTETQLCHDLRLAHAAGMNISVRQYPCGDELTSAMLSDTDWWIMDLVCGRS
ncbi:MAG: hypothetical protein JW829_09390 [Pirellulales bacterium]|nr:hypothetical protein [Pirellulales bacterium]